MGRKCPEVLKPSIAEAVYIQPGLELLRPYSSCFFSFFFFFFFSLISDCRASPIPDTAIAAVGSLGPPPSSLTATGFSFLEDFSFFSCSPLCLRFFCAPQSQKVGADFKAWVLLASLAHDEQCC